MKSSHLLIASLVLAPLVGCTDATDTSETEDGVATTYVNIADFGNNPDAWYGLRDKLSGEFTNVCGDTFCEGDYSNLTPLGLDCSVTSKRGNVHDCSWSFAGSLDFVDPTSAALEIDAPTFDCRFAPSTTTTATQLIAALQNASSGIDLQLPGTSTSIYDGLVDCFQHPIGMTPVTIVDDPTPVYVAATDYYVTAASRAKWAAAQKALLDGFNNVCGDTFCGGDFYNLQSLGFESSVTKSTGNIKTCSWVFGASKYPDIAKTGKLVETVQTWKCPVAVKGTLPALITTLTAALPPGSPVPIDRALPGETTSAYDALGGCLP